MNLTVLGDVLFSLHPIPISWGPFAISIPKMEKEGFLKRKFGGKAAAKEKFLRAPRFKFSAGRLLINLG